MTQVDSVFISLKTIIFLGTSLNVIYFSFESNLYIDCYSIRFHQFFHLISQLFASYCSYRRFNCSEAKNTHILCYFRGKFGEVKRCREVATGREFAAKFICAPRPQDKKDVEHEIDIMKKLQHKRLIQLYDAFETKSEMCLVLEM